MFRSASICSALAMWAWLLCQLLCQRLWLLFVAFGLGLMAAAMERAGL